MQVFFRELYSHINKNSGGKFEDMFLVKISNKYIDQYSTTLSESI